MFNRARSDWIGKVRIRCEREGIQRAQARALPARRGVARFFNPARESNETIRDYVLVSL